MNKGEKGVRKKRAREKEGGRGRERKKRKEKGKEEKLFLSFAEARFTSETMRTKVDFYCRYKRGVCTVVLHRNTWKRYSRSFPTLYLESRCPDLCPGCGSMCIISIELSIALLFVYL